MVFSQRFDELVARQAGVIAVAQMTALGMSARTAQRRVRDRSWMRLHPGVYLVGGHRLTTESRIRAAALWAGDPAAVTGPAAAWWHGMLDTAPEIIEVTVPAPSTPRARCGVRLRRRDLHWTDRVRTRDLWVAARPLAALETAVALPDGSAFLDRALQRHVRFPALYRAYCRNLGRHGSSAARTLITAAADRAESAAERLLVGLLNDAGIRGWVLGHPFGDHRIDLAFPAARVAVEVDGWAWHVDVVRFRADRRKGNAITRGGWDLLRYTWHDLDSRGPECVTEIRETLALAAA